MENRTINLGVVAEVAQGLKELKDKVVFIGGAVVSLYTDDPAADEIRPTADVDMTLNIMSFASWVSIQERLAELGFYPDPEGKSICSYKFGDIPVDIMTSEDGHLGPANRWYKVGFESMKTIKVKDEEIRIFSAPCFLATKFEAYNDRGTDYRTSHDFEDIIYVIDNCTTIVNDIRNANTSVIAFLKQEIGRVFADPSKEEIISAHIHPLVLADRYQIVETKMKDILEIEEHGDLLLGQFLM